MRVRSRENLGLCLLALAILAGSGCARDRSETAAGLQPGISAGRTAPEPISDPAGEPDGAAPDLLRPPVLAGAAGLEAAWLVSRADTAEFAAALEPFLSTPPPTTTDAQRMWQDNGLRIVAIPVSQWPRIADRLNIGGAAQRQWVDAGGQWVEIVRGPDYSRGQIIALDAERLELPAGRLRLLCRCWLTPVPPPPGAADASPRAELRVELLPQLHEQAAAAPAEALRLGTRPRPALEQGLVFSRLILPMGVRASDADAVDAVYLVLAERPGVDWSTLIESAATESRPSQTDGPVEQPAAAPGVGEVVRDRPRASPAVASPRPTFAGPAGPAAPLLPTLGEALFGGTVSAPTDDQPAADIQRSRRDARSILVIVPRTPTNYRLLPPAEPVQGD